MQREGDTCFNILRDLGIDIVQSPTQDPQLRIESVRHFLCRLVDGLPAFVLDASKTPMLRKGFQGAYCYRRLQVSGERYADKPDKGLTSHVHDSLQYICAYIRQGFGWEEEEDDEEYYEDNRNDVTGY